MIAPEPKLRLRALRHLARREYTRQELARVLAPHAESAAGVEAVLEEFSRRGWLSETRAAEQLVHGRRGRYGPARIRRDLEARGVSAEVIGSAVASLKAVEFEMARSVWQKKFREPAGSEEERAKQARFLLGRGFSNAVITRLLRSRGRGLNEDNGDKS